MAKLNRFTGMTDFRLRQKFRGRATPYRLRELTGNVSPPQRCRHVNATGNTCRMHLWVKEGDEHIHDERRMSM